MRSGSKHYVQVKIVIDHEIIPMAEAREQNLAQMSLAWVLKDPRITSVIIGASKPQQVIDSIGCLKNYSFAAEELKQIEDILQ